MIWEQLWTRGSERHWARGSERRWTRGSERRWASLISGLAVVLWLCCVVEFTVVAVVCVIYHPEQLLVFVFSSSTY